MDEQHGDCPGEGDDDADRRGLGVATTVRGVLELDTTRLDGVVFALGVLAFSSTARSAEDEEEAHDVAGDRLRLVVEGDATDCRADTAGNIGVLDFCFFFECAGFTVRLFGAVLAILVFG